MMVILLKMNFMEKEGINGKMEIYTMVIGLMGREVTIIK